ncbi:hypothetical protein E2C01_044649 [Portunus trituberculatus]|uniref:Uncharacterized protein n=1 Tax=Portunus trituberculatus TaxID=210409 RepID=A0A5B7FYX9_PORTR|nr:hypothetical protein [Portunus trituberculatus]
MQCGSCPSRSANSPKLFPSLSAPPYNYESFCDTISLRPCHLMWHVVLISVSSARFRNLLVAIKQFLYRDLSFSIQSCHQIPSPDSPSLNQQRPGSLLPPTRLIKTRMFTSLTGHQ